MSEFIESAKNSGSKYAGSAALDASTSARIACVCSKDLEESESVCFFDNVR